MLPATRQVNTPCLNHANLVSVQHAVWGLSLQLGPGAELSGAGHGGGQRAEVLDLSTPEGRKAELT